MQYRGGKQVAAVGGVVAAALALAACSSSSSSSTPTASSTSSSTASASAASTASGTLNASGSTFQLTYQEAAISAFKSVDPSITVNYSGVGSGTAGPTSPRARS